MLWSVFNNHQRTMVLQTVLVMNIVLIAHATPSDASQIHALERPRRTTGPNAAIAGERYRDWKKRFEGVFGQGGLKVVVLTGESSTDLKFFSWITLFFFENCINLLIRLFDCNHTQMNNCTADRPSSCICSHHSCPLPPTRDAHEHSK
jgi:hypothetical protein